MAETPRESLRIVQRMQHGEQIDVELLGPTVREEVVAIVGLLELIPGYSLTPSASPAVEEPTPPALTPELLEDMRCAAGFTISDWNARRDGTVGPRERAERVLAFCDAMLPFIPHDSDPF